MGCRWWIGGGWTTGDILPIVEFLLNFAWIAVSLLLSVWQWRVMRAKGTGTEWRMVIALGLLLVVLLPVISITDDLKSMTAAADVEHLLRRPTEPVHPSPVLAIVELMAAAALFLFQLRQQQTLGMISCREPSLVRLRQGLVRVSSVRPPPVVTIHASLFA